MIGWSGVPERRDLGIVGYAVDPGSVLASYDDTVDLGAMVVGVEQRAVIGPVGTTVVAVTEGAGMREFSREIGMIVIGAALDRADELAGPGTPALVHGPDPCGFVLGYTCFGMAENQRVKTDHTFADWREATTRGLLRRAAAGRGHHHLIASGKGQDNRDKTGKQQPAGCPPHPRTPVGGAAGCAERFRISMHVASVSERREPEQSSSSRVARHADH